MQSAHAEEPIVIPDKLYFRIGEVAELLKVETYVLRFWESEFPQLRPSKSSTGQRLYRKRDVEILVKIRSLLYADGYTIAGARQLLKEQSNKTKAQPLLFKGGSPDGSRAMELRRMKQDLERVAQILRSR